MKVFNKKDKKAPNAPIDNKVEEKDSKGIESSAIDNVGVEDNETAKQQIVLTSLTKKKTLSYGEILRARQGERKAFARRDKGDQGNEE